MNKKQKRIIGLITILIAGLAIAPTANAMHIMEGYLPAKFCVAWGIICIPFLLAGFLKIKKILSENRKSIAFFRNLPVM